MSGCGIKGGLATPPPLWGEGSDARVPDDNSAAESVENADDPIDEPDTPFSGGALEDDEEPGYGVDIIE